MLRAVRAAMIDMVARVGGDADRKNDPSEDEETTQIGSTARCRSDRPSSAFGVPAFRPAAATAAAALVPPDDAAFRLRNLVLQQPSDRSDAGSIFCDNASSLIDAAGMHAGHHAAHLAYNAVDRGAYCRIGASGS